MQNMEVKSALSALSALAHEQRLAVFRLLIRAGPKGLIAGDIATALDIRANTLSNNLNIMSAAGLIRSAREGRMIRYYADLDQMRALLEFLMQDCCGGNPDACRNALDQITCDC